MANLAEIKAGTLIGFSGNKTVDTAKTDTATNRVDICTTKQLYFNGQRIGVTDSEQTFLENGVSSSGKGLASQIVMSASDSTNIKTYIDEKVGGAVAGAYKFKKSVASLADLFKETTTKGDVYNITKDFTIASGDNAGTYKAGTNVAVNTAFAGNGTEAMIDPLGGTTVDLSPYVTNSSLKNTLGSYVTDSALTTTLASYYKKTDTYSKTEVDTKLEDYALVAILPMSILPTKDSSSQMAGHDADFAKAAKTASKGGVVRISGTEGSGGTPIYGISDVEAKYIDAQTFRLNFVFGSYRYHLQMVSGKMTNIIVEDYISTTDASIQALKTAVEQLKAQLLLA